MIDNRNLNAMDDTAQLLKQVCARDITAFTKIYDRFCRLTYGIALRILGDAEKAEELTYSVFVEVWDAPEACKTGDFQAWLIWTTRNQALSENRNMLRKRQQGMATAPSSFADRPALPFLHPKLVRATVWALPTDQRKAIELGFFHGMTYQEVASLTKTHPDISKARMCEGLRSLWDHVRKCNSMCD